MNDSFAPNYRCTCIFKNALPLCYRYIKGSIKESTRTSRVKAASRVYTLNTNTHLPPQSVVLTVTSNKAQLIDMVVQDLIEHKDDFHEHDLIITGSDSVPWEVSSGDVRRRLDLRTTHEEADTIII